VQQAILKASIALFLLPSRRHISGVYRYTHVYPSFRHAHVMNFSAPLAEEYKFGDISKEAAKRAKNAVANLLGQERWKGDSFSTHLPESDGKIYRLYRKHQETSFSVLLNS